MSLILEALRRSEAQRRRGQRPDLHTPMPAPVARRRARGIAPVLLALAVGTAIGLGWTLLPRADTPMPVGPVAPAPSPAPVIAPPAPPLPPSAAALARELDATPAPAAATPEPPAEPRPARPDPSSGQPPSIGPTASRPAATTDAAPDDVASLPAVLRETLPPLRLSMHVYDEDPARRFAIVDGQRVREGDALAPGLRVVAIGRDGLRLDWQGRALDLRR